MRVQDLKRAYQESSRTIVASVRTLSAVMESTAQLSENAARTNSRNSIITAEMVCKEYGIEVKGPEAVAVADRIIEKANERRRRDARKHRSKLFGWW